MTDRQELLARLYRNRPLAHAVLFKHRHPEPSPPFHVEMINDWHGPAAGVVDIVFRGGAKSTLAEEAIALMGAFREFGNCLITGENYDRAASRLAAIKRELEINELFLQAFGELRGDTWGEERLVLKTGACIQCLGKGQSLRGIKHFDQRPDLVFGDDLENRGDVRDPENRRKVHDWWSFDLMPAMDPKGRWRMAATTLHPEALPEMLVRDPEVIEHRYPWYYLDDKGQKVASWPERFPMATIEKVEASYLARGQLQGYRQEFMCQAEAPEMKPFKQEMFKVEPRVRTWQAAYSMLDPARSIRKGAATTGHVVWSWIGAKLIVWDAWARHLLPNEMIATLFDTWDAYHPAWLGVEEDGLNEFILQPIRQEQVKRGVTLPVKPVKAPIGKIDFIRGLQPFFQAREVEFAKPLPDLQAQLLGFPTGDIDAPNALAYALKMRPGVPIYDDFNGRHILEDMQALPGRPIWLCMNATRTLTTGVLLQVIDGCVRILSDYVREGAPDAVALDIVGAAQMDAGGRVLVTAGPVHFEQYNNVGLAQIIRKIPMEIRPGVPPDRARRIVRSLLQRERAGMPMLLVSDQARWVANAFAGGYAHQMLRGGVLADYAEEGVYRVLMEGAESYLALLEMAGSTEDGDAATFNATTSDGRRYRSMLGNRR